MIASAGALLGPGGAALIAALVPAFKAWLLAHWTHWGFVGAVVLFVSTFIALVGQEKRWDDQTVVRLLEPRARAEFRSVINGLGPSGSAKNVLMVGVHANLRHEGVTASKVIFPTLQLLERGPWRSWRLLQADLLDAGGRFPGLFLPTMQAEIPAPAAFDVDLWGNFTSPAGAGAFLGRNDLGIRITIDVLRQLPIVLNVPLPKPSVPPGDPAAPPPAGPPSSTASE
jgi:hypothetical protein